MEDEYEGQGTAQDRKLGSDEECRERLSFCDAARPGISPCLCVVYRQRQRRRLDGGGRPRHAIYVVYTGIQHPCISIPQVVCCVLWACTNRLNIETFVCIECQ